MSKKKYMKTTPRNCKEKVCRKRGFCNCEIGGHRAWLAIKYYGHVEDGF